MEQIVEATTLARRFETGLLSGFAASALLLSALGLFGMASLSVVRRRREFGVRLALGATRASIARLELARAFTMVAAGSATGLLLSLLMARAMQTLLYGVAPWNFAVYAIAASILIVCALLAVWVPAQRAARLDPASALRAE